jgi:hypothetical protein
MRNVAVTTHRERAPVQVQLSVDGTTTTETLRPLGLSRDGACLALLRRPLAPGEHDIRVTISTPPNTPPKFTWGSQLDLSPRHATVLTFSTQKGFQLER